MSDFYEPCEDSELLLRNAINVIEKMQNKENLKICEVGVGSGYVISNIAKKFKKKHEYFGCDINVEAIVSTLSMFKEIKQKINLKECDLLESFDEEFDLILFNTPYLPCEEGEKYENLKLIDKAIYGGKNGYEIIEKFILQVGKNLQFNSKVVMVFSSLSNFYYIKDVLKRNFYEFEILENLEVFFEDLICIKFWRNEFYYNVLEKGVLDLKYLASGKHSVVYEGKYKLKDIVIKVGLDKDISIEKMYLEKLQGEKFVPKFYFSGNGYVVREKVDGELIGDFLNRAKKREIEIVLNKILEVTLRMDELGINKKEMTNPYKHIYVVNKNNDFHIKMIDYERCIFTEKPKNTTQFLQYIRKNIELLKSKKIVLSEEKIFLISKEIKKRLETGEERKETKKEVGAVQLSDLI